MIRLLVLDEHPVIGEGIRAILNDQPDFLVETVTDVDSATAALDARHHDIVICEIRLQGRNAGLDLLRQRRKDGSAFIIFSAHSVPSFYAEAVEQGAAGFLPKTASPDKILRSIRTVARVAKPSRRPR
jgi:two-component system, NarL family, competent response regulator ComA